MAVRNQNFELWQGENKELVFTVEDADDLTGATYDWRMAKTVYQPAVVTKTGNVSAGATTVTVTLEPSDTENLTPTTWQHQLRITDSAGRQNKAAEGTITLHRVITT